MTKCDLCKHSHLKNGKLVCPYNGCILTSFDIEDIYKVISGKTNNLKR